MYIFVQIFKVILLSGMYEDVVEETGMKKKALQNIKNVSESVESSLRKEDLDFSHHVAVAPLEPEKQKECCKQKLC